MRRLKFLLLLFVITALNAADCFATINITLTDNATSGVFLGKTLCSVNDTPDLKLTVTGASGFDQVDLIIREVINGNPLSVFHTIFEGSYTLLPYSGSGFTYKIRLKNDKILFALNSDEMHHSNWFTGERRDGNFQIGVQLSNTSGSGSPGEFYATNFLLIEGAEPRIRITDLGGTVSSWGLNETVFSVLKGCVNDDPRLRLRPDQCGTDGFRVIMQEMDGLTGANIGSEFNKLLTAAEINDLKGNGFSLQNFIVGSNTLTLTPGKYYRVTVVYVGQNTWKPTFAFMHYKDGDWDLAMFDNLNDENRNGYEPLDIFDNDVFGSKYLWNKQSNTTDQNSTQMENPKFASIAGNHDRMFATIKNLGCAASPANIDLRFFWTIARTDELFSQHWIYGNTVNVNGSPQIGGSEITILNPTQAIPYNTTSAPFKIPSIAANSFHPILWNDGVHWFPPNPQNYKDASLGGNAANGRPSLCLLARINEPGSPDDPILWQPTGSTDKMLPYAKNNNNVVTRNTVLYDDPGFFAARSNGDYDYGTSTVVVNNSGGISKTVRLCLDRIAPVDPATFFDFGYIELATTNTIQTIWTAGGAQATNLSLTATPNVFRITNDGHACLENIVLVAGFDDGQIGVKFVTEASKPLPIVAQNFIYSISQTDMVTNESGSNTLLTFDVNPIPPNPGGGGGQGGMSAMGVKGVNKTTSVIIYPNPARDRFKISSIGNVTDKFEKVEIFDTYGHVVGSYEQVTADKEYNLSDKAKGLYSIKVIINGKTEVLRMMLQ